MTTSSTSDTAASTVAVTSGIAGTAFASTDMTVSEHIAGRDCPGQVFLSHMNIQATGRCLYYDKGYTLSAIGQPLMVNDSLLLEAKDYLLRWDSQNSGRGASP